MNNITKVIIDTNIYLNFYKLNSGQSLEMIKNLNQLIKSGKFKLVLPKQIEDEFIRNKNSSNTICRDHISNFEKGLEIQFKIPYLIKSNKKVRQIKKIIQRLNALKKEAVEDYKNRVFNPNSKINQQIKKLFSSAYRPVETDLILQKAWFRNLRGNPPRKDNSSFGDAIIWETILDHCSDSDLILISGDGDFESKINKGRIHELLHEEWSCKTDTKLSLYTKLGSFINENIKDKKKQIKEETIQEEDRLNSIFTTLTPLTAVYGNGENKCTCCGSIINKPLSYGFFGFDKCENCRYQSSPGVTCSKCGKHFHFHWAIDIGVYINNNLCNDCQKIT